MWWNDKTDYRSTSLITRKQPSALSKMFSTWRRRPEMTSLLHLQTESAAEGTATAAGRAVSRWWRVTVNFSSWPAAKKNSRVHWNKHCWELQTFLAQSEGSWRRSCSLPPTCLQLFFLFLWQPLPFVVTLKFTKGWIFKRLFGKKRNKNKRSFVARHIFFGWLRGVQAVVATHFFSAVQPPRLTGGAVTLTLPETKPDNFWGGIFCFAVVKTLQCTSTRQPEKLRFTSFWLQLRHSMSGPITSLLQKGEGEATARVGLWRGKRKKLGRSSQPVGTVSAWTCDHTMGNFSSEEEVEALQHVSI